MKALESSCFQFLRFLTTEIFICVVFICHVKSTQASRSDLGQKDAPGCVGENGSQVDWYAILKVPNGANYAYIDPTMFDGDPSTAEWKMVSGKSLDEASGNAVSDTLQQVYNDDAFSYVQYNDESPEEKKSSSYQGHTKGVWATKSGGGFWLIHSVPRYPATISKADGTYPGLPNNEMRYGQSFLCLSLDIKEMDSAAQQFYYNRGMIYDHKENAELKSLLPNFTKYVRGSYSKDPTSNTINITTRSGKFNFVSFAKTHYWDNYLYENLVSKTFKCDLLVESWMNGVNPDPSFCKEKESLLNNKKDVLEDYPYSVMNIRRVAIEDDEYGNVNWKETQDHSKWAVSTSKSDQKIACIGDINRQMSQNRRPGGTVCIENEILWTAFTKAIVEHDSCSTRIT